MPMIPKTIITVLFLIIMPSAAFSGDAAVPPFCAGDRVLIFAPHPDDEAIGTAGVIMRAKDAGAQVRVACFTNGEHNELAFIMYQKRPILFKRSFLRMGEVRRKESLTALAGIGISPPDVVFLGYPDFGTLSIMLKYWGKDSRPYHSILTRISCVSCPEALSPGAPYKGESILRDVRRVIEEFKPTKIFVSHPADTNMDHQALFLFLKVALWDMEDVLQPQVYPYIIHVAGWPLPRGFHKDLALIPPSENIFDVSWRSLELTPGEIEDKRRMIGSYKSQLAVFPSYLYTFARKNEIFGDSPELCLKESPGDIYVWQNISRAGESESSNPVSSLAFTFKKDSFFVKIALKKAISKKLGVRLLLLPYKKGTDFAGMPKISITIGLRGMQIRDKQRVITVKDARCSVRGRTLVVKLPFSALGYPDRLLCKTWARFSSEFPFRAPAWRIIRIGPNE